MEAENKTRNNKINVYTCQKCGGQIVTIDAQSGVTPFTLRCRAMKNCDGDMNSSFCNVSQDLAPQYQWRKPTKTEFYQLDQATREHVSRGGLLIYPLNSISLKEEKVFRNRQKQAIFNRRQLQKVAIRNTKRVAGRRLTAGELAIL